MSHRPSGRRALRWLGTGIRLRRPCFACYAHALVLPAFGGLTGALTLRQDDLARDGASIAVIGDGQLHWLQPAR